jgi:hypothetical protein
MDLVGTLGTYSKTVLNAMARSLGLDPPKDRSALVNALARQMASKAAVERSLAALAPNERALLERIQVAGGEIGVGALRAAALRDGRIDAAPRTPSAQVVPLTNARGFEQLAARLVSQGLALTTGRRPYGNALLGYELLDQVAIPQPVLKLLPSLPRDTSAFIAEPPPHIRSADAAAFQRDLYLYWSYLRDNQVTLTSRGLVSKQHLKKINALLSQQEPLDALRDEAETGRLRFLRGVLAGCKLVRFEDELLKPAPEGERFFAQPLAERVAVAFSAYGSGSWWDELLRIPELLIEGRKSSDTSAQRFVIEARKALLTIIGDMPAGEWVDLRRLVERVRLVRYEFLLPRRRNPYGYGNNEVLNPYDSYGNGLGWSLRRADRGGASYGGFIRSEAEGWDIVEAGFLEALLREPLHWLGLIDLGRAARVEPGRGESLVALRATPLGAHLLMGEPLPKDEGAGTGRLIVQPTFEVLAYPPVGEIQLALLDRIAERGRLEQVAEYRLTRESLYRARQQHGLRVEQVIADLERESGTQLPQNVAYTLLEWGRAQERVLLRDGITLLQVDDPALLDRLDQRFAAAANGGNAQSSLLQRLTPTAALVRPDTLPQIEAALLELERPPLLVERPPDLERGGPWLEAASDGALTLLPAAPRLYLRRALRAFATEEGARLRVSPASVRQAVADGLPVERIVAQLHAWSAGALPPELERQIKVWGGFFGSAGIERPTLLRLSDERTLAALLDDAETAALIRRYNPPPTLAEVDPRNLAQLRQLLAARGVELAEESSFSAPETQQATPVEKRRGRPRKNSP